MRRSTILATMVAAVLALALVACSSGATSTPATPSGTGTTGGGTTSSSVTVSMKNIAFDPATVDIQMGDSVTFVNNDTVQHNLSGDWWTSGPIDPGQSYTQRFSTTGANPERCTIHPSMTMTVNVK
jgi:plastocyanin